MKILFSFLSIFFFCCRPTEFVRLQPNQVEDSFALTCIDMGLGGNLLDLKYNFNVEGRKFIYISEEIFVFKDSKPYKVTQAVGDFRRSSIDSIMRLIEQVPDSTKRYRHVRSGGGLQTLHITTGKRKISYELWNQGDTVSRQITDILNSYIPLTADRLCRY